MKTLLSLALLGAVALATPANADDLPSWAAPQAADAPVAEAAAAPPPPPPAAPAPVPLDGGLALLALAGAGYAAKRLRAEG